VLEKTLTALPVELEEVRPGRTVAVHKRCVAGSRKTLIFVHGSAASLVQWQQQIEALAATGDTNVVAYDAVGCGRSPKPIGWDLYSTEALYDDLKAVISRHGGAQGHAVSLIAHSAGCCHVLRFAAEAAGVTDPDCVSTLPKPAAAPTALVLIAPLIALPSSVAIFRLPVFALELMRPLLSGGFAERALHPKTRAAHTAAHRELLLLSEATSGANPMHMCRAYYRQIRVPAAEVFAGCKAPTLIVGGEEDRLAPFELHASSLSKAIGPATRELLILPEAAHQVMQEQPEAVCSAIAAFIAGVECAPSLI